MSHIRENMSLDCRNIHLAMDSSLQRLKTDYVGTLYQIHWPQRNTKLSFGQFNYPHLDEQQEVTLIETLEALAELVKAGKLVI